MKITIPARAEDIKVTPVSAPDVATQIECVRYALDRIERASEEALRMEMNAAASTEAREEMHRRVADALHDFGYQWGNVREILKGLPCHVCGGSKTVLGAFGESLVPCRSCCKGEVNR